MQKPDWFRPTPLMMDRLSLLASLRRSRYASPTGCFELAGRLQPWFWWGAALLALAAVALGITIEPSQFDQGDAYRIVFVHVPAAWMSLVIYLSMALWAAVGLAARTRVSFMMAAALAPTGAMMTVVALWTGALWGRPTAGAWWAWDAQFSAELMLLVLYLAFMVVQVLIDEPLRRDRAGALVALAGALGVPLLYFAAHAWTASERGIAAALASLPATTLVMVSGLLLMTAAFWAWSIAASLHRMRSIILEREADEAWALRS